MYLRATKSFGEYMYERLPAVYRDLDEEQDKQLKRYLESIAEGSFTPIVQDTLKIMDLLDADKCPSQYLPMLCENFGVEYYPNIGEAFQRKFLKNFVELNIRKGTASCIEYLVRELSGYEVSVSMDDEDEKLVVTIVTVYEDDVNLLTKQEVIEKYIVKYIPVGLGSLLLVSYNYIDSADFISDSTDEVTHVSITQSINSDLTEPTLSCNETNSSVIMETSGIDTGRIDCTLVDNSSLTNEVSESPQWFSSNNYSGLDTLTVGVTQTIIFN
jgi:phage tail-like protein